MNYEQIMRPLNLPKAKLKLIRKSGEVYVWDDFRMKQLLLTPEEWVRQHVLKALVNYRSYPPSCIVSEQGIMVNGLNRRCDGVVYKDGKEVMIIECKAPHVNLDEAVIHQIAQYNFTLRVSFLMISNGLDTLCYRLDLKKGEILKLEDIPTYDLL